MGAALFWLGIGLQALLTGAWQISAVTSFAVQGVISVELSFLLNRYWTWRTEPVGFWRAWRRFNAQKFVASVANVAVYLVLLRLGLNYLAANVATTALFTVVNYAGAHYWAFRPGGRGGRKGAAGPAAPAVRPVTTHTVSVIVPCRGSARTIRATVDSLLGQDYPGLAEVILVGSAGDTTWQALHDITDPRLVILEQPDASGLRDPNVKRDAGIRRASSEVLALADSDIVMPPDWLSRGLGLLAASGASCVAGGMESIHDSFWGRFVDGTRMAAKTPRVLQTYVVTKENFGRHGRKPPVTANVILTRELYRDCPLDVRWCYGYEDYEWFWRIAASGHRILFSSELAGRHHHRRGLRPLCREYLRSSDGCARFVRSHPDCPLARKRLRQVIGMPMAALALAAAEAAAVTATHQLTPLLAACLLAVAAAGWEYARQRNPEALLYPMLNAILGAVFLFGLARGLTLSALPRPLTRRSAPAAASPLAAGLAEVAR